MINSSRLSSSQSPQTGQVYFNTVYTVWKRFAAKVSIPSNGSSLFQYYLNRDQAYRKNAGRSQSPQTGQVYFNQKLPSPRKQINQIRLNPLKRVKFISILTGFSSKIKNRVFVSIPSNGSSLFQLWQFIRIECGKPQKSLNPLKRVKFISI